MNPARPNSVVVDFNVLPVGPDAGKVHNFLENDLKLKLSDVKQIQFHNIRKCVFIEMISFDVACRYETEHNLKHHFLCGDNKFAIHVYLDSELTAVRVHDLPPTVNNVAVHTYMQQFGTVTSVTKERWKHYFPGVYNGVRVVHIRLRKPIPSYITVSNHQSLCTYKGQKPSCRVCGKAAHPKQKCSEAAAAVNETATPAPARSTEDQAYQHEYPPLRSEQTPSSSDEFGEIIARVQRSITEEEEKRTEKHDNFDSFDDNSSSSSIILPSDPNDTTGTAKRRLSTRRGNEEKKVCPEQCFSNAAHGADENRTNIFSSLLGDNANVSNNKNKRGREKCSIPAP